MDNGAFAAFDACRPKNSQKLVSRGRTANITNPNMAQCQRKKSQKRYEALFADGMSFYQTGDDQAAAEKFLQAVHEAPLVWTKHRFFAFSTFLASIKDCMTESEIEIITEDFIGNEAEPPHFRAVASLSVAFWYNKYGINRNLNTTAEFLRQGLDIIAASSKEDENRQVLYSPYERFSLDIERCANGDERPDGFSLKAVLTYMEPKLRKILTGLAHTSLAANQNEQAKHHASLLQRSRAGGMVCDCCGKTLQELQIPSFKRCSRCEMVFYCSPTCQREHWKKMGHKQACREKGEIKIGDGMQIHNPTRHGGELVKVISCVGEGQWQVKYYGSNRVTTVNGSDLLRIRPPSTL